MNKVILIGHLGKDAETSSLGGATTVTKFSLATTKTWKDKAGTKQQKTEWHSIELWNKQALEPFIKKGGKLMVEGEIVYSVSEKNGAKTYFTAIRAENIEFLSAKNDAAPASAPVQTYQAPQNTPEAAPEFDAFLSEDEDTGLPF